MNADLPSYSLDPRCACHTGVLKAGFTLIEILIVVTIMGVMLAMAGSGASSMMTTLRMKEAIENVANSMEHARQLAMTSNHDVVFRIYRVRNDMGEDHWRGVEFGVADVVTNPDAPGYQDPTAANFVPKFKPTGAPTLLPSGMVFHPSATYSTLVDVSKTDLATGTDTAPDGTSRTYISFRFLPDGRCSLGSTTRWTLTLVRESEASAAGLPANFSTMQLEPTTARIRTFRP